MMIVKPLYGYNSVETSLLVSDYPYGNKRCHIRYWLESDPKKGFRFCSQTEHPTKKVWNAPKKSTYSPMSGCMFLDENEHVHWTGLSEYSKAEDVLSFIESCPEADMGKLLPWCKAKCIYLNKRLHGELGFTVAGAPVVDSDHEKGKMQAELVVWRACVDKLGGLF